MGEIKKALQGLEKAIENNLSVQTVKVIITLKEPKETKQSKAKKKTE